jgi:hypothetical protein
MGVAFGGSGLTMPEHLANEIEAVTTGHGDRGDAVPKVMNADIVEPGRPPDALPRLLDADEMSIPRSAARTYRLSSWRGNSASERVDAPSGTVLAPVLLVGQHTQPRSKSIHSRGIHPTKRLRED